MEGLGKGRGPGASGFCCYVPGRNAGLLVLPQHLEAPTGTLVTRERGLVFRTWSPARCGEGGAARLCHGFPVTFRDIPAARPQPRSKLGCSPGPCVHCVCTRACMRVYLEVCVLAFSVPTHLCLSVGWTCLRVCPCACVRGVCMCVCVSVHLHVHCHDRRNLCVCVWGVPGG